MNYDRLKFRVWDKKGKTYNSKEFYSWALEETGELLGIYLKEYTDFCIDKVIVEQCTGLKDKNGKLIYEGDILLINGERWRVIWNDEDCAFFFSSLKEVYHQPIFQDFYMMTVEFNVIGNVQENPELLK